MAGLHALRSLFGEGGTPETFTDDPTSVCEYPPKPLNLWTLDLKTTSIVLSQCVPAIKLLSTMVSSIEILSQKLWKRRLTMCQSYKINCACNQNTAEIFFGKMVLNEIAIEDLYSNLLTHTRFSVIKQIISWRRQPIRLRIPTDFERLLCAKRTFLPHLHHSRHIRTSFLTIGM